MAPNWTAFGTAVRRCRDEAGLSQATVIHRADISDTTLRHIEKGERRVAKGVVIEPTAKPATVGAIAAAVGMDADEAVRLLGVSRRTEWVDGVRSGWQRTVARMEAIDKEASTADADGLLAQHLLQALGQVENVLAQTKDVLDAALRLAEMNRGSHEQ